MKRKEVKYVVIPQIILPSAGNATTGQPGTPAPGTEAVSAEGLFAELLASLQGFVGGGGLNAENPETGEGENAVPLAEESIVATEGEEAESQTAVAELGAVAKAVGEVTTVSGTRSLPEPVEEVVATQLQRGAPSAVIPAAKAPPPSAPSLAGNTPPVNLGTEAPVATPVSDQATVQAKPAPPVRPEVPVTPAPTPSGTVPTQPPVAPETPLPTGVALTDAKPTLSTVSAGTSKPAETLQAPVASAATGEASVKPEVKLAHEDVAPLSKAVAKSDGSEPLVIAKAKPGADAPRSSDETLTQPLRKAVESFAKPAAGQSESVANVPRPQAPVVVPVVTGDSTVATVGDVTRVSAAIAPAELGAEAPKSAAAPATTEAPARSTLPELAETALRGIRYLARNGEHRMTVKLVPESLGQVHIEVLSSKEALSVKLVADSAMARDVMESHIHQLRDSLSQEGLEVRSITISDEPGSGRGASYQRDANASRNGERGQSPSNNESSSDQSSARQNKYATPRARHEGAFDRVA